MINAPSFPPSPPDRRNGADPLQAQHSVSLHSYTKSPPQKNDLIAATSPLVLDGYRFAISQIG
jgi:hypothetical protein